MTDQLSLLYALLSLTVLTVFIYWQWRKKYQALYLDKLASDRAQRKFQLVAEQSPLSILITTPRGIVEFANEKFCEISGYQHKELIGRDMYELIPDHTEPQVHKEIIDTVTAGQIWQGEMNHSHRNGNVFFSATSIRPVFNDRQHLSHIMFLIEDISDRIAYRKDVFLRANFDSLTGLPNRDLAIDRLNQAISNAQHQNQQVTIICVDLDRFKMVNDTLGHHYGDHLLIESAKRLQKCVTEKDTVARLGGGEFIMILVNPIPMTSVLFLCKQIVNCIAEPFFIDDQELNITATLGLTICPNDGTNATYLIRNANAAMHTAKAKGNGSYHFYTPEMNKQSVAQLTMDTELRHALERNELQIHYQPVIDVKDQSLVAVEALLRWQSTKLGRISTPEFINLAEENGQIIAIGEWVLQQACKQVVKWHSEGLDELRIAVNISPRQIIGSDIVSIVQKALDDSGLKGHYLDLEITESLMLDSASHTLRAMHRLKKLGVRLSLDDFGTGYSSLSYLKRYPFDTLKIDRSFVRDIHQDTENAALAKAIITMSHILGLEVVGEGVELLEQFSLLEQQGCNLIQGYLFSEPVTATHIPMLAWEEFSSNNAG